MKNNDDFNNHREKQFQSWSTQARSTENLVWQQIIVEKIVNLNGGSCARQISQEIELQSQSRLDCRSQRLPAN